MAELIVRYPDRAPDHFPLGRLRITIGRSARNDLCIPDPFASRVHAEVRREGDGYLLQDLGSANGTLYNGSNVEGVVPLTPGGRIQIARSYRRRAHQTRAYCRKHHGEVWRSAGADKQGRNYFAGFSHTK